MKKIEKKWFFNDFDLEKKEYEFLHYVSLVKKDINIFNFSKKNDIKETLIFLDNFLLYKENFIKNEKNIFKKFSKSNKEEIYLLCSYCKDVLGYYYTSILEHEHIIYESFINETMLNKTNSKKGIITIITPSAIFQQKYTFLKNTDDKLLFFKNKPTKTIHIKNEQMLLSKTKKIFSFLHDNHYIAISSFDISIKNSLLPIIENSFQREIKEHYNEFEDYVI